MKRARLCTLLALLAGFSLHGQGFYISGVQDVAGGTSFAPGSLAYIFCGGAGFNTFDTQSATVGGLNAYTVSVSSCALEIQIPFTAPLGANVLVGYAGLFYPITISQYAPILMPQAAGASAVSAWHSDGTPVSPTAPAMPNETINMYAVGLGPTSPAVPAGGTGQGQTTTVPTVTLAGNQVTVLHATLGGAGAGIYPVYFTMPANPPSGNQNVSVSIGGVSSNTLALAVGPAPAISAVLNNYSFILPGAASGNYGIAPGSIFVIFGTGMATPGAPAVLQDSTKGLPTTLNGASVAVTVAGITMTPALYYATPTQIAGVLPSLTPLGTGTVTVAYDEMTSAPATTQVVQSALGFATMSGDGTGQAMATDANYNFISPTSSAAAGQIIALWGTGLGAAIAVSDTTYTGPHQITNIPLAVYVGGAAAQVIWAGRSGYPGLDQIDVQLPMPTGYFQSVLPVGCSASLNAVSGGNSVGSNNVTLPATVAGGACGKLSFVLDPGVAQTLGGQTTVNVGSLSVSQGVGQAFAGGYFEGIPGASLAAYAGSGPASEGSCIVVPAPGTSPVTRLFAGSVSVNGVGGTQPLLTDNGGFYGGALPVPWTSVGGTYTFVGTGGSAAADIGPDIAGFTSAVNSPASLDWTNQKSIGAINRSQGVRLTWTGGDADGVVAIRGSSFAAAGSPTPTGSFMCSVPAGAGQFTVPASVLNALPTGAGTLTLENQSASRSFTASGLDIGYAFAGATFTINAVYN
jgi:uncharacterized protein (TIGR03437 family)